MFCYTKYARFLLKFCSKHSIKQTEHPKLSPLWQIFIIILIDLKMLGRNQHLNFIQTFVKKITQIERNYKLSSSIAYLSVEGWQHTLKIENE